MRKDLAYSVVEEKKPTKQYRICLVECEEIDSVNHIFKPKKPQEIFSTYLKIYKKHSEAVNEMHKIMEFQQVLDFIAGQDG